MDGFTAATSIRAFEKTLVLAGYQVTPLPIVAVSANSIESKPHCVAVGMQVQKQCLKNDVFNIHAYIFLLNNIQCISYELQGYITKPMRKPDLVQHLRHVHGLPAFLLTNTPSSTITIGKTSALATTSMSPLACGMIAGTSPERTPQLVCVSHSHADTPTQFPSTSRQALSLRPLGMRTQQVVGHRVPLAIPHTPRKGVLGDSLLLTAGTTPLARPPVSKRHSLLALPRGSGTNLGSSGAAGGGKGILDMMVASVVTVPAVDATGSNSLNEASV